MADATPLPGRPGPRRQPQPTGPVALGVAVTVDERDLTG